MSRMQLLSDRTPPLDFFAVNAEDTVSFSFNAEVYLKIFGVRDGDPEPFPYNKDDIHEIQHSDTV